MILATTFAQEKKSKADILFYGYDYKSAIVEYQREMTKAPLKNSQLLNLADSYYNMGDYKKASEVYLDVHKKDTVMSSNRFNKMLQSLSKTASNERVKAFLNSKRGSFSNELLENAEFNEELLSGDEDNSEMEIFNLNGNSPQADFAPGFYNDKLLFSSGRAKSNKKTYEPSGESYLDIYEGRISEDGNVRSVNPFTAIAESKFHKATPFFSKELGKLFYVLSNTWEGELLFDDNGKNALAIAMSDMRGSLTFLLKDLSTSFYYPYYDAVSSKLYFAASFEDSYGGTDLYYVYTNNGQIMSEPTNLGPRVNSPGNEIAPFIFDNSLYFSSDIFYGVGGMDMYKAKMHTDGSFGIPINLGKSINSTSDDFSLILKENGPDGLLGYFSSNRGGGKGNDDIYGLKVKNGVGLKTFTMKGRVVNLNSKDGIDKSQVRLIDKEGNVLKESYTNENGEFRIEIPWQEEVTVQATKERHSVFTASYMENELEKVQNSNLNLGLSFIDDLLTENEGKPVIKLQKFYFDTGKADITPTIQTELDKVVDAIQRFPQLKLIIETHTNSKGSKASNQKLSQNRSDAIKNYLLQKGVISTNIVASIGYGEEKLTNKCADGVYCLDFLHKQNDRTLIVIANSEEL
jgi:outer membrane protein OmpA-like peptidoglycan-associated protein